MTAAGWRGRCSGFARSVQNACNFRANLRRATAWGQRVADVWPLAARDAHATAAAVAFPDCYKVVAAGARCVLEPRRAGKRMARRTRLTLRGSVLCGKRECVRVAVRSSRFHGRLPPFKKGCCCPFTRGWRATANLLEVTMWRRCCCGRTTGMTRRWRGGAGVGPLGSISRRKNPPAGADGPTRKGLMERFG